MGSEKEVVRMEKLGRRLGLKTGGRDKGNGFIIVVLGCWGLYSLSSGFLRVFESFLEFFLLEGE